MFVKFIFSSTFADDLGVEGYGSLNQLKNYFFLSVFPLVLFQRQAL